MYQSYSGALPSGYTSYPQGLQSRQVPQYTSGMGGPSNAKPIFQARRRLNVIAISLAVFVPWLVFCLVLAMLSFHMHYLQPSACKTILIVVGVVLGAGILFSLFNMLRSRLSDEYSEEEPTMGLFVCITALIALFIAMSLGDHNYYATMAQTYDIQSLNTYDGVDPALMRGQGLMDAGRVTFAPGTQPLLTRAVGFRNEETYCVAPLTGGVVNDVPLTTYDFWIVGTNCCSSTSTGADADFRCGAFNVSTARGGIRVVRDEERSFYRLAVQQAEAAFQIKAVHPLFFRWVVDPDQELATLRRGGFQFYFVCMFAYFGIQLLLVAISTCVFNGSLHAALYKF